jgi:predicted DCC family thiol-disulfide oxidoreductase YuxK
MATLQERWVEDRLGVTPEHILDDLRLLLSNGDQIAGADVYRYVMRRIWWAYPLYLFSAAPISRSLFNWGYRIFADNRHRISNSCGIPNSVRKE